MPCRTKQPLAGLVTENPTQGYRCTTHIRYLDRLLHDHAGWRIVERRSVYDASFLDRTPFGFDAAQLASFPHEYAALGHVLTLSGLKIDGIYPVRDSHAEQTTRRQNAEWLCRASEL